MAPLAENINQQVNLLPTPFDDVVSFAPLSSALVRALNVPI